MTTLTLGITLSPLSPVPEIGKTGMPDKDLLLVIAYALMENRSRPGFYSPSIIDFGVFPVYECILARDRRMYNCHGGWFGNFETPTILSNQGNLKLSRGQAIDYSAYGRKENEGKDLNEDTNFGKLKRIPYRPLQNYIKPSNFTRFFE